MEHQWPPQLDFKLLNEWCAFCEGRQRFGIYHFATLLMEVFQTGMTPEVDEFTKTFAKYFPKGLYDNLCRYAGDTPKGDAVPWARRELAEMRSMLERDSLDGSSTQLRVTGIPGSDDLVNLIDQCNMRITHDRRELVDIQSTSANHRSLYFKKGEFVRNVLGNDVRHAALTEVLYNLSCCNYFLVYSLMDPLFDSPVDFNNYFEMYLRGCDYAFGETDIVIFVHQRS